MSYLISNEFGVFCSACGEQMSMEEIDWDCCDACGGEGFGGDDDVDDFGFDPEFEEFVEVERGRSTQPKLPEPPEA